MDPYISTGKESIEKERVRINRYISCNIQEGNQRWNIKYGSTKPPGDLLKNEKEESHINIMED